MKIDINTLDKSQDSRMPTHADLQRANHKVWEAIALLQQEEAQAKQVISIKQRARRRYWQVEWAAAAAILLIFSLGYWYLSGDTSEHNIDHWMYSASSEEISLIKELELTNIEINDLSEEALYSEHNNY